MGQEDLRNTEGGILSHSTQNMEHSKQHSKQEERRGWTKGGASFCRSNRQGSPNTGGGDYTEGGGGT